MFFYRILKLLKKKESLNINKHRKPFSKKVKDVKWIPVNLLNILIGVFNGVKNSFVYRSYWGRGSTYKQILHAIIFVITLGVALSGISYRLFGLNAETRSLSDNYLGNAGNVDLLQQGGGLQTVLVSNPNINFKVWDHTVLAGESLQSIADKYGVTKDTIKWANMDKYGTYQRYTNEDVVAGEILKIPQVAGVLYQVKAEDNLDTVLSKTSGDRFSVIEVNQLQAPDFNLANRSMLLIPNGRLDAPAAPPPTIPIVAFYRSPSNVGVNADGTGDNPLNGVIFSNPLSNPDCGGYSQSRGFLPWHNGVDLARAGGCPIRSVCDGTVTFTGWSSYGEGYNVRIDCGGGVRTDYYHGDGNIWVSPGQQVSRGQDIMYMGCTGNCTGTHLHFGLRLNGEFIDPAAYVPY